MKLPLCLEDYEPELSLTVRDRRELVSRLAEQGTQSINKYIADRSIEKESGIAKLVKRLRAKLDAQINRTRERIERRFKRRNEEIKRDFSTDVDFSSDQGIADSGEVRTREEMDSIDREIDSRLVDILSRDDILDFVINLDEQYTDTAASSGLWGRFKSAFRRFINYIANGFRRFVQWLRRVFGRSSKTEPSLQKQQSNILLRFPAGQKVWDDINHNLNNALATSPNFRRAIERDLNISRARKQPSRRNVTMKKYFDKAGYSDEVRKEINRRIKRVIKSEQRKLDKKYKLRKRKAKKMEQLRSDKSHTEVRRRDSEARIKQLEKQKSDDLRKLKKQYSKRIHKSVQKELMRELEDIGYVQKTKKDEPRITTRLIDRFAEIVLSDELSKLPTKYSWGKSAHGLPHGVYEKKKLQTVAESSRMDIVASLVNARVTHPGHRHIEDTDIITHREMRSSLSHVILIFDKSGSMEENNRIQAAKKAVLALYKAIKHRNSQNIVDFIAFDSTVQVMDLLSAWRSSPSGFTNTAEALSTAHQLIKDSVADRKLIYLITDGLPEAYTDPRSGEPRAGNLEKSLSFAVKAANKFKKIFGLKLTIILLEPKEEVYTEAAGTIAKAAGGSVMVTDPHDLAAEMLMNYIEV
jgi:Mg-chelatase subunit ChlD